ncbi:creatininase family protein [Carboxylicivirga sp. N1Y90]|uniref:creatininase family protein n=1 Tax=Carboxylicivirga fragile TaxID=3417571 RepID=UPI003D34E903|nr:creatininase family protein [Marinilabiliaceae bacterium N1Y90]
MTKKLSSLPYILDQTNWGTVKQEKYEMAILPWGATEPHNYHLPYATDTIQAKEIAVGAAAIAWQDGVKTMVLPAIPLGLQNPGQLDLPFCLNTRLSTQKVILEDILMSLQKQGIKRLVIINSHGGNDFKSLVRDFQTQFNDFFIGVIDWFKIVGCDEFFDEPGDHAGEMETSLIQYLHPDLVTVEEAGDGRSIGFKLNSLKKGVVWTPRNWAKISSDTGVGNPKMATSEKGEKCFKFLIQSIANALREIASVNPDDLY